MNRSTFWMNGSIFSKASYMNGVGFEILARTPIPKLPLSSHFEVIIMNFAQNICLDDFLVKFETYFPW